MGLTRSFLIVVFFLTISIASIVASSHIVKVLLEEKIFLCPIDSAYCDLEIWNNSKITNITVSAGEQLQAKFYKYNTTTTSTSTTTSTTTTTTLPPTTTTTLPEKEDNNFYTFKANQNRDGVAKSNGNGNRLLWKVRVTGDWDEFASPIVVDGVIYWNSRAYAKTYALDAYTGKIYWEFPTGGSDGSPTYDSETGILYVAGNYPNGYLWALNSSIESMSNSKREIWKFKIKGDNAGSSPALGEDLVFILDSFNPIRSTNNPGNVYAIDKLTGIQKWSYDTGGRNLANSPTYWNGRLYVCANDIGNPEFFVFNAITGKIIWTSNLIEGWGCWDSSPVVDDEVVYIGDKSGRLHAFNAITGQVKWSIKYGSDYIITTPTIYNGKVFFGGRDAKLWAVDKNNGNIIWTFNSIWRTHLASSVLATPEGLIYFYLDGRLYAVNETNGIKVWEYYMGRHGGSSPAVYNGVVYIGTDEWYLYAIGTPIK